MNLVTDLQVALERAGIKSKVTYDEEETLPMLHLDGEWCVGVDGSMLNVGLGPYAVNHPEDEDGKFPISEPLATPADVIAYLREHGAVSAPSSGIRLV
jgi:hypothetical protein